MRAKDRLGRWGEDVAVQWLTAAGMRVVDRNWRGARGELDIVAVDGDDLVVVEVKTRSGPAFGHPAEAVDGRKLANLRRLTGQWIAEHGHRSGEVRIDVVAVRADRSGPSRVEHLRGVSA